MSGSFLFLFVGNCFTRNTVIRLEKVTDNNGYDCYERRAEFVRVANCQNTKSNCEDKRN